MLVDRGSVCENAPADTTETENLEFKMAQFGESGNSFNDYLNIDRRGRCEGEGDSESGSEKDDYFIENAEFFYWCAGPCASVL